MKVLIVSDQLPEHDLGFQKSGHAQYLGSFIDYFARRGDEITMIVFRPKVDFTMLPISAFRHRVIGPGFVMLGRMLVVVSPAALRRQVLWNLFSRIPQAWQASIDWLRRRVRRARGAEHELGRFVTAKEIDYTRKAVLSVRPDLVVYDGIFNSCGHLGDIEHWLVAHEVKHQRTASFESQGVKVTASSVSADLEASMLATVDVVVAIQRDDASELQRLAPNARVIVVPAVVATPRFPGAAERVEGRCLFVGSGSYHNYDGITWFLEKCWKQIRIAVPNATLDVCGSVCYRINGVPAGVKLRGVVEDLSLAYSETAVTIVPLRVGSGLKVKVVEAFAHGQALITTSIGAQGLMHCSPRPFVVADGHEAFAMATIDVLRSRERQLELREAAMLCAKSFTPESAFHAFEAAS